MSTSSRHPVGLTRIATALAGSSNEERRWGLLQRLTLPAWLEIPLALVLLDYTLYAWHVALHKVPWLWRFHRVHHADLDLDATTALRFHGGELALSVPWHAAQILLLGISPRMLSTWQRALAVSVFFHHANVRLPIAIERTLNVLLVTPRMHGIHHSIVQGERDSNWSSGLTIWDLLHGTLCLDVPQEAITIGASADQDPSELTLPRLLTMPFRLRQDADPEGARAGRDRGADGEAPIP